MYTQQDLDEAIAAGALTPDAAASLRNFVDTERSTHTVDEEQFRLITSFNDIFVSIASIILLVAVGWISQSIGTSIGLTIEDGPSPLAPAAVAATAWGLALFFTAKRRMALPSILLLLAFVGGVFVAAGMTLVLALGVERFNNDGETIAAIIGAASAAVAVAAAYIHWRRFHVPITVAAGALAVVGVFIGLLIMVLGDTIVDQQNIFQAVMLLLGIGVFLFAMRWDSSDPTRQTRRSDVAFWLHLLAAPMIVQPVFTLLGLTDGDASIGEGLIVIALYIVLAIAALAIDRRAFLVSALAYVLYALTELFKQLGAVELNVALTALVIGSALLLLSAFWHQARRMVVERLPASLQGKLPTLDRTVVPAAA